MTLSGSARQYYDVQNKSAQPATNCLMEKHLPRRCV
jgi:hypothetical protein